MGPYTAPRSEMPACSRSTMSLMLQSPRPPSLSEVREGAYQFCNGIRPPANCSLGDEPPSELIFVWHKVQCPRPSTRYAPRFHSTDCVESDWYSPSRKYSVRQP